jgi:hypothetical protein
MNVVADSPTLALGTRERLWAEHLEVDPEALHGIQPDRIVDEHWRPIAEEQRRRVRAGEPMTHRLLALPGVSRRARRLLGPLDGLLADG